MLSSSLTCHSTSAPSSAPNQRKNYHFKPVLDKSKSIYKTAAVTNQSIPLRSSSTFTKKLNQNARIYPHWINYTSIFNFFLWWRLTILFKQRNLTKRKGVYRNNESMTFHFVKKIQTHQKLFVEKNHVFFSKIEIEETRMLNSSNQNCKACYTPQARRNTHPKRIERIRFRSNPQAPAFPAAAAVEEERIPLVSPVPSPFPSIDAIDRPSSPWTSDSACRWIEKVVDLEFACSWG